MNQLNMLYKIDDKINASPFQTNILTLSAKRVKSWSAYLVVLSSVPGGAYLRGFIAHCISLSLFNRSDRNEILIKRTINRKSSIQSSD